MQAKSIFFVEEAAKCWLELVDLIQDKEWDFKLQEEYFRWKLIFE